MNSPTCVASRHVDALTVQFSATVRRPQRREALLFALFAIVEHSEDPTTPELADHLLGEGRIPMMEQLLYEAENLQLIERLAGRWKLATLGLDALQQRVILVPEFGEWEIELIDDDALGAFVLRIDRIPPTRLYKAKDEGLPFSDLAQGGELLDPWVGRVVEQLADGDDAFIQSDPPPVALLTSQRQVLVNLFPLQGRTVFDQQWSTPVDSIPVADVLQHLDIIEGSSWDRHASVLRVPATKLSADQLLSARLSLDVEKVELPEWGLFEQLVLTDLPCAPVNQDDATQWVLRRAIFLCQQPQTLDVWSETIHTASSGLSGSSGHPNRKEVASLAKEIGAEIAYWNLIAPTDWNL